MITAQIFTFYIIQCEFLSGDLFYIDSIFLVILWSKKRTMVIVWLQAGQKTSARMKVDCLTVVGYLINSNLSMIGK